MNSFSNKNNLYAISPQFIHLFLKLAVFKVLQSEISLHSNHVTLVLRANDFPFLFPSTVYEILKMFIDLFLCILWSTFIFYWCCMRSYFSESSFNFENSSSYGLFVFSRAPYEVAEDTLRGWVPRGRPGWQGKLLPPLWEYRYLAAVMHRNTCPSFNFSWCLETRAWVLLFTTCNYVLSILCRNRY